MEQQDNLPIGIAQEPEEEARHLPVRLSIYLCFIIDYSFSAQLYPQTLIFYSFTRQ